MKIFTAFLVFSLLLCFSVNAQTETEFRPFQETLRIDPQKIVEFVPKKIMEEFGEIKYASVIRGQIGILAFTKNGVENIYAFSILNTSPVTSIAEEYAKYTPTESASENFYNKLGEKIKSFKEKTEKLHQGRTHYPTEKSWITQKDFELTRDADGGYIIGGNVANILQPETEINEINYKSQPPKGVKISLTQKKIKE